ncbi:TIGR00268 family protein, partial [Marine Group I thaumarchaeote]|nr:TIGR00268 family protein [Marine Group I thaumarchaeote]
PWGQSVTAERLARIEIGEKIVKQLTGAKQVRVRDMNGIARIEVGIDELHLLENNLVLQKIKSQLKLISFEDVSVDPEGYRPGKINVITN